MGAYTLALATTFNGFTIPKVYYAAEKKVWSVDNIVFGFICVGLRYRISN